MKVSLSILLAALAVTSTAASPFFEPTRLSYQELEDMLVVQDDLGGITQQQKEQREQLKQVLQEVGLFSITDIPGMRSSKPGTLEYLIPCLEKEPSVAHHVFPDGTLRETLATTPGQKLIEDAPLSSINACNGLERRSRPFRATVAEVSRTVAELLQELSGLGQNEALLKDAHDSKKSYNLQSMINEGQQLEHLHLYRTTFAHAHVKMDGTSHRAATASRMATLDWHTDQGLFLLFSPGVNQDSGEPTHSDFFVQLPDGPRAVRFDPDDELVVLLGEGTQQYVNPHLDHDELWRAVPHSLRVQEGPRVWYGLMVMPPAQALHPVLQRPFGELRAQQIQDPEESESFGCGSSASSLGEAQRNLQETEESCTPGTQLYCWHRCMNFTETVSPTACESANTTLACINQERQLWTGDHNPDFFLGCAAEATGTNHSSSGHAHGEGEHKEEEDLGGDSDSTASSSAISSRGTWRSAPWVFLAGLVAAVV